jgi:hypothetical protein
MKQSQFFSLFAGFSLFVLLCFSFLQFETAQYTSCAFYETQYSALRDLYDATEGTRWNCPTDMQFPGEVWNFSTPVTAIQNPCQSNWQGINCSYIYTGNYQSPYACGIEWLILGNCGLMGTVPESIGNLRNLTTLALDTNYLTGSIPNGFYSIQGLLRVNISSTYLNGTISGSIGNLQQLQYFEFTYNYFWGTLPKEIYSLVNLNFLYLNNNYFSGSIAEEIRNLRELEELFLTANKFTSSLPSGLFTLTRLTSLIFDYNEFTGTLSPDLGNLINLEYCWATSNSLFGTLPNVTNFLPAIINFEFGMNLLHGTIPFCFLGCHPNSQVNLVYLYINSLSGMIPNFVVSESRIFYWI